LKNEGKKSVAYIISKIKRKVPFIKEIPTNIKILSEYKGNEKTFDIDDDGKADPYINITERFDYTDHDENDYIKFKALNREANKIIKNNFEKKWNNKMVE
jgi:hypothetical protein